MMNDIKRLQSLSYKDSTNSVHTLHPAFYNTKDPICFCNTNKMLDASKIRKTFMLAAIISPSSDCAQDLFQAIQQNIVFLNEYISTIPMYNVSTK
jgi:hypothetical protein